MFSQCLQITRATVVLVYQSCFAVADNNGRVATWSIGNRSLYVNRNRQAIAEIVLFGIACLDEVGEAK
jgi:hypothetical protein